MIKVWVPSMEVTIRSGFFLISCGASVVPTASESALSGLLALPARSSVAPSARIRKIILGGEPANTLEIIHTQ